MQVIFGADGYVVSYADEGTLVDGMEVADPEDLDHFQENFKAYKLEGHVLVHDPAKTEEIAGEPEQPTQEERIAELEEALELLLSGVTN